MSRLHSAHIPRIGAAALVAAGLGIAIPSVSGQSLPRPTKLVYVMMENSTYGAIIGNTDPHTGAPYVNSLLPIAANMTKAVGITHPTDPNYMYAISGTNQGITGNTDPRLLVGNKQLVTPNFPRNLLDVGYTFANYAQNLPANPYTFPYQGGPDGDYYLDENVSAYWVGTGKNQIPATCIKDFKDIPADFSKLPTVSFWHLTETHNMHQGFANEKHNDPDNWLRTILANYVQWAMKNNSMLILTWDESYVSDEDPALYNHIPTLFVGPMVRPGNYSQSINHIHVLRTMEDMFGVAHAGAAATTAPVTGIWKASKTETPIVSLDGPVNFTDFSAPANITLTASVVANGHTINKVQFYNGATLLGEATSAPYTYSWNGAAAAPFGCTLSAKVVYDGSGVGASAPVFIGVWPTAASIGTGLVAYLNFDDNMTAQGGTSVNGAVFPSGRTPRYVNGKIGRAADFLNTGESAPGDWAVSLGNLDSTYAGDFSYSFWVKSSASGDYAVMGNKNWASGTNTGWVVSTAPSAKTYSWKATGGNRHDVGTNPSITDGAWHLITQTFDRTNNVVSCYIDGKRYNVSTVGTNSGSLSLGAGFNTLVGASGPGSEGAICSVDDVAIWSRVVSPVEIAATYANGLAGKDLFGNTPPPPPANPPVTDNLRVYLKMDGDMTAKAGTAIAGTAFAGTPHYATGKFGQAASFANTSSATAAANDWSASLGNLETLYAGDFTLSLWIKTTRSTDSGIMGNKDWNAGANVGWVVSTLANKNVNWNTSGGTRSDVAIPTLNNGSWHLLNLTCDRTSGRLVTYLDGAPVSNKAINSAGTLSFNAGYNTLIGASGPGTYATTADVDDVALWSRALSASEIADIYTRGQSGQPLVP